jgi:hypothetical protein
MKFKKLASVCAAVLMVGCLTTSAFAASAPVPLPNMDTQSIVAELPVGTGENQAVMLSEVTSNPAQNGTENSQTTAPEGTAPTGDSAESGGFMDWYMGLFNSPAFLIGFVAVIGIVALVLFKAGPRKTTGKKSSGKSSHRTDGL